MAFQKMKVPPVNMKVQRIRQVRLTRFVDILRILETGGAEADGVRQWFAQRGNSLTIDTIQRDMNHLVTIGLATRTRCCGDPYWFSLTDLGRRVFATFTQQED